MATEATGMPLHHKAAAPSRRSHEWRMEWCGRLQHLKRRLFLAFASCTCAMKLCQACSGRNGSIQVADGLYQPMGQQGTGTCAGTMAEDSVRDPRCLLDAIKGRENRKRPTIHDLRAIFGLGVTASGLRDRACTVAKVVPWTCYGKQVWSRGMVSRERAVLSRRAMLFQMEKHL